MSQFKKKLTAFTAMLTFLSLSSAAALADVGAIDTSANNVIGKTGNVAFEHSTNRTDVNITSAAAGAVGQVDWKTFSVGANNQVNFGFNGLSQTIINRVLGGQASEIMGKMTSSCMAGGNCGSFGETGKVVLINPAGIVFGAGSMVDINSFTASTFDFRGAQNISGTLANDAAYQVNVLNKLSPVAAVNGTGKDVGTITFDSNYTQAFDQAGVSYNKGATSIALDGATFAHFANNAGYDNTAFASTNPNKSIAIVSDNISYKDSLLRTGKNYNYGTQSMSNVRLVTADGVTFDYLANGYVDDYSATADENVSAAAKIINIDNSGLPASEAAINSGDIHIVNKSSNANSKVNLTNTVIKADKLINAENGDIFIENSAGDINLDHARLATLNTTGTKYNVDSNGNRTVVASGSTKGQAGGEIYLKAGKSVDVKDSTLKTTGTTAQNTNAGRVRVYGYGEEAGDHVTLENTVILSDGNTAIASANVTNVNNSTIEAANGVDNSQYKNARITGSNEVNINDSLVAGKGNVEIISKSATGETKGNINITGSGDAEGDNSTLVYAGNELKIEGKNTLIDDSSLRYKTVTFHDGETTGLNNVTIKDNTTFTPIKAEGGIDYDLALETNGNLTFDHATAKISGTAYNFVRDENGKLVDDGTPTGIQRTLNIKSDGTRIVKSIADNIDAKSTQGNVTVTNGSDIKAHNNTTIAAAGKINVTEASKLEAGNDITATAAGDVTVDKSTVRAGSDRADFDTFDENDTIGDANLTSTTGSVYITNNSTVISEDKDVNVTAYKDITFGAQGADGVKVDNTSNIKGEHNVTFKSTNDNIVAEKTTMPTITYGDELTFDAAKSNIFTSQDSLKSVNVNYKAGESNRIYTQKDAQFVNSTFEAPVNFVESGKDVILNNLEIKQATADAADTVTQIFANGNVTTDNVTGEALGAKDAGNYYTYPQSVDTNRVARNGETMKEYREGLEHTTLDINKTKLQVTTDTVKNAADPDNGSITLDLKNADNTDAGIELEARNVIALDNDSTDGYFKEGYYKSGEFKWDEVSTPKEGPEVHVNAVDDELAVSKIITDKLTLDPEDKLHAAAAELTPEQLAGLPDGTESKGYIEVRDYMGFNLDDDFTQDPTDITYDWSGVPGTAQDLDGNPVSVDTKHIIHDNDANEDLILIYNKPNGEPCPPEPPVDPIPDPVPDNPEPGIGAADSYVQNIRLPREQVEVSRTSRVVDNTVDQTSNIMSAAARVDLSEEAESEYDDEDAEEATED